MILEYVDLLNFLIMNSIDLFLLSKFQKISDWFQEWFGIDNFFLAWVTSIITLFFYFLKNIAYFNAENQLDVIGIIFALILTGTLWYSLQKAEHQTKGNTRFTNPAVLGLLTIRIFFLGMCIFSIILLFPAALTEYLNVEVASREYYKSLNQLYWIGKEIFMTTSFYFCSCTPKPKKPSKVKKMVDRSVKTIQKALSGNPTPIPTFLRN